jgi:hypothetical protein
MSINKSEPTWWPNNTVHENEQKESPDPAKVAPTNVSPCVTLEGEDYGLKVSITAGVSRVQREPERFDWTLGWAV